MDTTKRILYPDVLRILAAFAVIMIHISELCIAVNSSIFNRNISIIFCSICLWSVPCFFMISGMFMLSPEKEKPFKKILKDNFLKMFILFIFWNILYFVFAGSSRYNFRIDILDKLLYKATELTLSGKCFFHLWYIPVAAGLYLISPILKNIMSKLSLKILGIICFFVFTIVSVGIISQWNPILEKALAVIGYICLFMMGSIISRAEIKGNYLNAIYIAGALGLIIISLIHVYHHDYFISGIPNEIKIDYLMPVTVFTSSAIILFFKNNIDKIKINEEQRSQIINISSLTLGIYIVHVFSIFLIRMVYSEEIVMAPVITIPIFSIISFIISLVLAFILKKIPFLKYII